MLLKNRLGLVLSSVLLLAGCASVEQKPSNAAGTVIQSPDGTPMYVTPPKEISSFRLSDPEPAPVVDKELEIVPPEMQSKVEQWVAYFQGKGRVHMERYLARSTRYIQLMKRIMKENGLPEDLVYVALIESGFSSRATSRAAAVGYWQFMKGTGKRFGLQINSFVDERRDPVLSTQAAAEYFKGLYSVFGSWYLAMASYNVGENRVKREMIKSYSQNFWELARKRRFPKETANYIPKYVAARMIAKNPEKYGFSEVEYDKPQEFDLIKIDKPVNMKLMAQKMNVDYEDFKILNPKFRGEIATPKNNVGLELRVPVGQVQQALAAAQESVVNKVEFVADTGETETYRVRPGDSLFTIAHRYHTTVSWLRDVNDIKAGKKLRIGMRIQVPDRATGHAHAKAEVKKTAAIVALKAPEKSSDDVETASSNPEVVAGKNVYYIVQSGDTLSSIADEYDSTIRELRKMNKLGKRSLIKVGMKLRVPKDEGLPKDLDGSEKSAEVKIADTENTPAPIESKTNETTAHVVKAGENLTTIAHQYGITVKDLRDANKLKKKSKLMEGTTLFIPVKNKPTTSVNINSRTNGSRRTASLMGLKIRKLGKMTYHTKVNLHALNLKARKKHQHRLVALAGKKETRDGL